MGLDNMSGFTGFIGNINDTETTLQRMMDTIIHRGPDASGTFIENEAALGYRQLKTMDRENEHQPYFHEDEALVLVFDGQIYNAQTLRDEMFAKGYLFKNLSDSEVIIRGYEVYGKKITEKLRGKFAFIIWDRQNKKLFGARDQFGVKPFYYAHMNSTFLFGSEIKSLLPHPSFQKELNEKALKPYLTFQSSILDETFFKGVFKLPAAHYFTYDNGILNIQRYWTPNFTPVDLPLDKAVNDIDNAVKESIHIHQATGEKAGSFLSSGVDSSYVTSVLKPTKSFTVGFSNQNFSEIDNAKKLSSELNIENINKVIDPDLCFEEMEEIQYMMDEPHSNPSIIPLFFLAELASQDVKVIFSGEGADELFGGYDEYDNVGFSKKYKKLPALFRKTLGRLAKPLPEMRGRNFLIKSGLPPEEWFIGQAKIFEEKELQTFLAKPYQNAPSVNEIVNPFYHQVKSQDDLTKMQFLDMHLWLIHDILLKADKMSMAHSLDVRMPFLDREVMKVASKLPTQFRVNDLDTKYAFRLAGKRQLPEDYANRKKIGFPVPIHHWIKVDKYYFKIKAYFEGAEAKKFFDQKFIINLLNNHYDGKEKNGRKIWSIYVFLVWYKRYFGAESNQQNSLSV